MSTELRARAIAAARDWFDEGNLLAQLTERVRVATESQNPEAASNLAHYLENLLVPWLANEGFSCEILQNPVPGGPPFLVAERIEDAALPTILSYGHGDVVRGYDAQWRTGLSPWSIVVEAERWYGRGTADNKGQHTINLCALAHVLHVRGHLGFNVRLLIEMGEEVGSPGLKQFCREQRARLRADVLIASDGPRLRAEAPTVFLGSRGALNFELSLSLREGSHHSGNWGGLLANPAVILANAIACLVDQHGVIQVEGLRSPSLPQSVKHALSRIEPGEPGGPVIDPDWGDPEASPAERVFGGNVIEVLAMKAGNPEHPVNAIPGHAQAHLQLRFVVGCDVDRALDFVRSHLRERGFAQIEVKAARADVMSATRSDPEHPWVQRIVRSLERTLGREPYLLPNIGGSLPNDCFADVLAMPTVWIPHSYPACSQHAPNEHLLAPVAREGLEMMVGLFWDLGELEADPGGSRAGSPPSGPGSASRA